MQNMNAVRQQAVEIAREAGALIMSRFGKTHQIDHKAKHDVVTDADKAAENLIVPALRAAYPSHHFVGEEGGSSGAPIEEAEYRWYIDPIDGTTNFASSIPHFCTSIALTGRDNRPILGIVYDPYHDEMFVAERGLGATLNDRPISVRETDDMDGAVLVTGFPYDRASGDNNFAQFEYFAPRVRGVRRFGSAALDMCWVACGRVDAYWEWRINPWDFFGAWIVVTEAGGRVTDFDGEDSPTLKQGLQVMATNQGLFPEMVAGMQATRQPAV